MVCGTFSDAYEIVLGGYGNTQFVIRSEHPRNNVAVKEQRDVVTRNKAK